MLRVERVADCAVDGLMAWICWTIIASQMVPTNKPNRRQLFLEKLRPTMICYYLLIFLLFHCSGVSGFLLPIFSPTHLRTNSPLHGKRRKSDDVLAAEKDLMKRGFFPILGSDESGRGCIAGPVVTATCAVLVPWEEYTPIPGVRDSKELSPVEREKIYELVVAGPKTYAWSIVERTNKDIDESNILRATMDCFRDSIEKVVLQLPEESVAYSIVDGKKGPKLSVKVPSRPWVQGDKEVYSVALASIIAKVSRDRMALEWSEIYPEYGFDVHQGYATPEHKESIHKHGPCPIHRMSFKSLKGR